MSRADHLGTYAKGWQEGDVDTIMTSLADSYVFDDPMAGEIPKAGMPNYFAEMTKMVSEARGGQEHQPFMELSEIVTQDEGNTLTAWCWWSIPGTDFAGAGLIKAGDEGIRSEVITYYAPPVQP
jgi:hypothetical protein